MNPKNINQFSRGLFQRWILKVAVFFCIIFIGSSFSASAQSKREKITSSSIEWSLLALKDSADKVDAVNKEMFIENRKLKQEISTLKQELNMLNHEKEKQAQSWQHTKEEGDLLVKDLAQRENEVNELKQKIQLNQSDLQKTQDQIVILKKEIDRPSK